MVIKDLLVHLDQTPVAQKRLDAALTLGQHFNAHVTALYLIAEPFVRGAVGYHLPDEVAREHLRHAEAEADTAQASPHFLLQFTWRVLRQEGFTCVYRLRSRKTAGISE